VSTSASTRSTPTSPFGAEDFSELCRELEERAKDGGLIGTDELVDRIDGEYVGLPEALAALRAPS
jgi:hypothetical protein